jgi:hypothetical protein
MFICYYGIGWLPECRGATVQQSIQGGSSMLTFLFLPPNVLNSLLSTDGDPILGEFYVKYGHRFFRSGASNSCTGSKDKLHP